MRVTTINDWSDVCRYTHDFYDASRLLDATGELADADSYEPYDFAWSSLFSLLRVQVRNRTEQCTV